MLPISLILVIGIVGLFLGAYGRHLQGGAGKRWEAMVCYGVCCIPALLVYGTNWYVGTIQFAALAAILFLHMTLTESFGNLWWAVPRYTTAFFAVALITNCPPVVLAALVVWLTMKWAKEPAADGDDPHQDFEYINGGLMGLVIVLAPLLGSR